MAAGPDAPTSSAEQASVNLPDPVTCMCGGITGLLTATALTNPLAVQVVQQRAARQQQADDEDRVAQELHRQGVERDRHIKSLQKLHAENAELRDLQSGILAAQVRTSWGVLRLCVSAGML